MTDSKKNAAENLLHLFIPVEAIPHTLFAKMRGGFFLGKKFSDCPIAHVTTLAPVTTKVTTK
jgi:hypothetical protein